MKTVNQPQRRKSRIMVARAVLHLGAGVENRQTQAAF